MSMDESYPYIIFVIRVYLVGSTPGRYVGPDMERWGHLRLRKVKISLLSLMIFKFRQMQILLPFHEVKDD